MPHPGSNPPDDNVNSMPFVSNQGSTPHELPKGFDNLNSKMGVDSLAINQGSISIK